MTLINSLSLNAQERQSMEEKIKERVISPFNLSADFGKLQGNKVDYSVLNRGKVQTLDESIGERFTVPVKTYEGLDGEVHYGEVNGSYFYNITTKTRDNQSLNKLRKLAFSNHEFGELFKHLITEGYTTGMNEEYVLQNNRSVKGRDEQSISQYNNVFVLPVYKNNLTSMLAIDETSQKPIFINGNERTFIQDNNGIVTVQADACYLRWIECMTQELNCDTWQSCLLTFGSCLGACCTCNNPFSCVGCAICAISVVGAAWDCRMCVGGAARPEECPV